MASALTIRPQTLGSQTFLFNWEKNQCGEIQGKYDTTRAIESKPHDKVIRIKMSTLAMPVQNKVHAL